MVIRFILLGVFLWSSTLSAAVYTKQIKDNTLRITAPRMYRDGDVTVFSSQPQQKEVVLTYGKTKVVAGKALFYNHSNKILLAGGFTSQYMGNAISGNNLVYNPQKNFYDAEDVLVQTRRGYALAERFSFYGEKISLRNATLGINLIKLDLDFGQLDLYPGWIVAYGTQIRVLETPVFYVPCVVEDRRRNAYKLPAPLPEFGKTDFRGEFWRWNTNYYVADWLYGNVQFGRAKEKGAGYGGQHIIRLSDLDQVTYINDNWQYARTQEVFSYEHSFVALPKKPENMSFNDLLRYNEALKELSANSIRFNRTQFEEVNKEIIHRDHEMIYEGRFELPKSFFLYTRDSTAFIYELTSERTARKNQVFGELERILEIPWFGAFTPGLGYDNSHYTLRPYSWHRLYDYVYASRAWGIFEVVGRATDYLDERGGSPFRFDQRYVLHDNIKTGMYVNLWNLKLGQEVQYQTYNGKLFDIGYMARYKAPSWTLNAGYSLKRDLWTVSIQMSLL